MDKTEFENMVSAYKQKRTEPTEGQKLIYLDEVQNLCPLCASFVSFVVISFAQASPPVKNKNPPLIIETG